MKTADAKGVRTQIDKAKSSMVVVVALSTVVTIFCLISTKSLLSQGNYQRQVINERNKAVKQLKANITAANQLKRNFEEVFQNSGPINIIGGKNDKSQAAIPPDGDNARIVLNALPSSYDFPALVTSMDKILKSNGVSSPSVGGTDQPVGAVNAPAANPEPIRIDVPISGTANFTQLKTLMNDLQRSIRPYDITSLQISGNNSNMSFNFQMHTYYQPPKSLDVGSKVQK